MKKDHLFVALFIILVAVCVTLLIFSLVKKDIYSTEKKEEDKIAVEEFLQRENKLLQEVQDMKKEFQEFEKIKTNLKDTLKKQKEINNKIEKRIEELKETKQKLEEKYQNSYKELKELKSKINSQKESSKSKK